MSPRSDGTASDLETIDLDDDADAPPTRPGGRVARRRTGVLVLSAAVVVIGGLAFVTLRSTHHHARTANKAAPPASLSPVATSAPRPIRSTEPLVGRFYPALDRSDMTTIVLPTGQTFRLTRGAAATIGGLGATFFGTVRPKGATCCALNFTVLHAAPSDVFAAIGPNARSVPVLIPSARVVLPDLRQVKGRFGLLSTGDWTLIASFEDGDHSGRADAVTLQTLSTWHLRATPYGAIVRVPAGATVDNSEVDFGEVPDISDTAVTFHRSFPCQIGPTPTYFGTAADTTGRWCNHGLAVTIEGPRPYVQRAVAGLEITPSTKPFVATRGVHLTL